MNTRILITAFVACALAAVTGCRTAPPPPPPPPPVYSVNATADVPDAASLASSVALDVRGALVARGYPVMANGANPAPGTPVVAVDIVLDRRTTARLDIWRTYEGTVKARVVDGGFIRAEKAFKATGKRADNERDAESGMRNALSSAVIAWLSEVLPNAHPADIR